MLHKTRPMGTESIKDEFDEGDADFHQIVADMANISKKQAKTINLGLFYGMGKNKLQAELGSGPETSKRIYLMNLYHGRVPLHETVQELIAFAKQNKLLEHYHDRFCRFDRWETTNNEWNPETNRFNEGAIIHKRTGNGSV